MFSCLLWQFIEFSTDPKLRVLTDYRFDGTKKAAQKEQEKWEEYYSGKKDHMIKSMIICNEKKRIGYISDIVYSEKT